MSALDGRARLARAASRVHPGRPGRAHRTLERTQWTDPGEIAGLQVDALRSVLSAAARVPFYRARLSAAGLNPAAVHSVKDLRGLPPLERTELQDLGVDGLAVPPTRGLTMKTSGSTGRPVSVLWSLEMAGWSDAADRRAAEWLGVPHGARRVRIRANPAIRAARNRAVAAVTNFPALDAKRLTDPASRAEIVRWLAKRPPCSLEGLSDGLYALALAPELAQHPLRPICCVSGANHLQPHYRETIAVAFDCPVFERYATVETGLVASPCAETHAWHVVDENVIVEVVADDGRPCPPGEVGHVLLTCLRNRAMPLIRYRIGDMAIPADSGPCRCGRGLSLFGELIGRSNELLARRDGGLIAPNVVVAIMTAARDSVEAFQVHQRADHSLDVRLVQRQMPDPEPVRRAVADQLDELLRQPGAARVVEVERVEATAAGKLRHIVSDAVGPIQGDPPGFGAPPAPTPGGS